MGRGLYNQNEGNEHNPNSFTEHLTDNGTVEGAAVKRLKRASLSRIPAILDELAAEGHSKSRRDAMLSQAMHGRRF